MYAHNHVNTRQHQCAKLCNRLLVTLFSWQRKRAENAQNRYKVYEKFLYLVAYFTVLRSAALFCSAVCFAARYNIELCHTVLCCAVLSLPCFALLYFIFDCMTLHNQTSTFKRALCILICSLVNEVEPWRSSCMVVVVAVVEALFTGIQVEANCTITTNSKLHIIFRCFIHMSLELF